jgi:hypothetical protein
MDRIYRMNTTFAFQNFAVANVDDVAKELKGTRQAQ